MFPALLVLIIAGFVIFWWEECGHGLTSRPRESASALFLDEFLFLFRYPVGSGRALFAGTLPLRYCFDRFACRTPTWSSGGLSGSQFWFAKKTNWTQQKRLAHLAGFDVQSRPRVWTRLYPVDFFRDSFPGHKRRRCAQEYEGSFLLRQGQGWVNSLGCACPRLRLARSEISCLLRCMREVM